jgi:hypothetical protein
MFCQKWLGDIRLGKELEVAGLSVSAFLDVSHLFIFTNIQPANFCAGA